jgi:hypothetical protein
VIFPALFHPVQEERMRAGAIALALCLCIGGLTDAVAQDLSPGERVVTNVSQLAGVFRCDVFCMPTMPPDFQA